MIYYKDINGNIYTGDKADYRDKELTAQELETYLAEQQKNQDKSEAQRKLDEIDRKSVRALRELVNPDVIGKDKDDALDIIKGLDISAKAHRDKLK